MYSHHSVNVVVASTGTMRVCARGCLALPPTRGNCPATLVKQRITPLNSTDKVNFILYPGRVRLHLASELNSGQHKLLYGAATAWRSTPGGMQRNAARSN